MSSDIATLSREPALGADAAPPGSVYVVIDEHGANAGHGYVSRDRSGCYRNIGPMPAAEATAWLRKRGARVWERVAGVPAVALWIPGYAAAAVTDTRG